MLVNTRVKKKNRNIVAITHTISFYISVANAKHILHDANYDTDMGTITSRLNSDDTLRELVYRYLRFNDVDSAHLNLD